MPSSSATPPSPELRARTQVANLAGLFVLSMTMFDRREEADIFRLALSAVANLGSSRAVAAYLTTGKGLERFPIPGADPVPSLDAEVAALSGEDGRVTVEEMPWAWALSLRSLGGHSGYLVVGAAAEPTVDEQFLLQVLAHQAGAALTNASLHRREQQAAVELRTLNERAAAANMQLAASVAELQLQTRIHDVLTEVAVSGRGEQGIAQAVHDLTGRPVAVEDRFGNLRAWAGPGEPVPYTKLDQLAHDELLREAGRQGRSVRDRDRLIAVAQPGSEVLGVLALVDPDRSVSGSQVFALEHGATVLALELAHQQGLAEVELRLRRDVVDDLISGTDGASAYARAAALGYDMHGTHHVLVVLWYDRPNDDALARAVERAAAGLQLEALQARRSGVVVLITHGRPNGRELYAAVCRQVGSTTGGIGLGGRCDSPADLPRSFEEALRALEARKVSRTPEGVTAYDDLGIYRLLAATGNHEEVARYVQEWLGPLLDYDTRHGSDLVQTLSQYFECGGNYDSTSEALVIHRSTLRYRLQRIRELTGMDIGEVETRLNLHLATRAWRVLQGGI